MSSALPLAKVLCGPVNTRKYPFNVPGTANISYGHKLPSLQGGCRLTNERTKEYQGGEESKDPEYERIIKLREFEQHANRRIRERRKKQRLLQGSSYLFISFSFFAFRYIYFYFRLESTIISPDIESQVSKRTSGN